MYGSLGVLSPQVNGQCLFLSPILMQCFSGSPRATSLSLQLLFCFTPTPATSTKTIPSGLCGPESPNP
jgi:hypothetical protein